MQYYYYLCPQMSIFLSERVHFFPVELSSSVVLRVVVNLQEQFYFRKLE